MYKNVNLCAIINWIRDCSFFIFQEQVSCPGNELERSIPPSFVNFKKRMGTARTDFYSFSIHYLIPLKYVLLEWTHELF